MTTCLFWPVAATEIAWNGTCFYGLVPIRETTNLEMVAGWPPWNIPLNYEDYYENATGIRKSRNRSITALPDYNPAGHMLRDQRPYFPIPSFTPPLPKDPHVNYTCTRMSLCAGANDRALMNMGSVAVCSFPALGRCYLGHSINLPVSAAADTISAAPS